MLHLKTIAQPVSSSVNEYVYWQERCLLDPTHASPQIDSIIMSPLLGTNVPGSSVTKYVEQHRQLDLHANGLCVSTTNQKKGAIDKANVVLLPRFPSKS